MMKDSHLTKEEHERMFRGLQELMQREDECYYVDQQFMDELAKLVVESRSRVILRDELHLIFVEATRRAHYEYYSDEDKRKCDDYIAALKTSLAEAKRRAGTTHGDPEGTCEWQSNEGADITEQALGTVWAVTERGPMVEVRLFDPEGTERTVVFDRMDFAELLHELGVTAEQLEGRAMVLRGGGGVLEEIGFNER